jgi:hypothetical protein
MAVSLSTANFLVILGLLLGVLIINKDGMLDIYFEVLGSRTKI